MNIVVIGYGDQFTASTRFRFSQFDALFQKNGDALNFLFKSQIKSPNFWEVLQSADVIINQKCLLPKAVAKRIFALQKPVYFDFDDAIWTRPGRAFGPVTQFRVNRRFRNWLRESTGVMVANSFLAESASFFSSRVHVVPMALDTRSWKPGTVGGESKHVALGWNGSPNNLALLERIEEPLGVALAAEDNVSLKVFCGKKPDLNFPFEYHTFDPEKEISFVQSLDIGLLPLLDDAYSAGKSPIKGLQYLACGVPVVGQVNQGGMNFLTKDTCLEINCLNDWTKSLVLLIQDAEMRRRMAAHGVDLVRKNHCLDTTFDLLRSIISS